MKRLLHVIRAQTLIEALLAIGLLAILIGSMFPFFGAQYRDVAAAPTSLQSMQAAEEGLAAVRSMRDAGWGNLAPGVYGVTSTGGGWSFVPGFDTAGNLTRTVSITDISTDEKLVTVSVRASLNGKPGRAITVSSFFTNWRNAQPPLLRGDWQHPQTLGSVDLGPGNAATGLAVQSGIVYMTATASDKKKPDFYTINAVDGRNPWIIKGVDTGPGLSAVALSGTIAYAANSDPSDQLQIMDVSNPSSPILVKSLQLTGNNQPATAVAVSGTTIFISTKKAAGPELFIVNASDPFHPTIVGSLEIGDDVGDVFVFQNRVLLATASDTGEFMVVNATNPASPSVTSRVDINGGTEDGVAVYANFQDQRAYVGRTVGASSSTEPQLSVFDLRSVDAPRPLGTLNFAYDVNGVYTADALMFLTMTDSNQEFKIYNTTDPARMTYYSGLNFPQIATRMALENNTVYVAVRSNDALRIITSP